MLNFRLTEDQLDRYYSFADHGLISQMYSEIG